MIKNIHHDLLFLLFPHVKIFTRQHKLFDQTGWGGGGLYLQENENSCLSDSRRPLKITENLCVFEHKRGRNCQIDVCPCLFFSRCVRLHSLYAPNTNSHHDIQPR